MIDVYEVVKKLIGPISPIGETQTDTQRLENLKGMITLVDKLLTDLEAEAYINSKSQEYSRRQCVEHINEFLGRLGITE